MQMGIYRRLVIGRGRQELNRGGAYVSNSHSALYTYVTVGVVLYVPLHSLPISKVKRVYRFLFHTQLFNSLNHTDFLSTSSKQKWVQEDINK